VRKVAILLLFMGGLGFTEHPKAQIDDALAKPIEKLLAVHAEAVKQSYCHVDDESFVASNERQTAICKLLRAPGHILSQD
jgi:hypothetical protein